MWSRSSKQRRAALRRRDGIWLDLPTGRRLVPREHFRRALMDGYAVWTAALRSDLLFPRNAFLDALRAGP